MSKYENLDHSKYDSWRYTDAVVTEGLGTATQDGAMVFVCRGTCGMLKLVNPPKDGPRLRSMSREDAKYFEAVSYDVRSKDCNAEIATRLEKRIVAAVKAWYEVRNSVVAYDPLLEIARPHEALMCRQAERMYEMPKDDFLAMLGQGPNCCPRHPTRPCPGDSDCDGPTFYVPQSFGNVDIVDPKGARKLKDVPAPPPLASGARTMQEIANSFMKAEIAVDETVTIDDIRAVMTKKAKAVGEDHGFCGLCGGIVRPVYEYYGEALLGGPPQPRGISSWNCERCYIMYAKKPVRRGSGCF